MRSLIVTENITLDGVIDASEGWFVPSGSEDADDMAEMAEVVQRHMATADALLVGRVTFEELRGYWPHQVDDPTGVADYLNATTKYVISSSLQDPRWQHTTVLSGPVEDEVAALKAAPGEDITVTGSITLVHALSATGLVDEYRLFVYPVVLGRGRRLFERTTDARLALVEARPFRSGVLLLRYRTT